MPVGTFEGRYAGRRWIATRSVFSHGQSEKLVAEAADGSDHVSMNLYRLASGIRVVPCEMPLAKVRAFVLGLIVGPGACRSSNSTLCRDPTAALCAGAPDSQHKELPQ